MPYTTNEETRIYYEDSANTFGKPLLLINGNNSSLLHWHPEWVATLERHGFRVIRFDNREAGRSDASSGDAAYTLQDMANDAVTVLTAAGVAAAHVVGTSMGGMIGQRLALDHPDRVLSYTQFYSSSSWSRHSRTLDPSLQEIFHKPEPLLEDEWVAWFEQRETAIGLNGFDRPGEMTDLAHRQWSHQRKAGAGTRQQHALAGSPDRLEELRSIDIPVAIIHGLDDQLIHPDGSTECAAAIRGAELHLFAGLKHEVARGYWPEFAAIISRTANRSKDLR